MFIQYCSTLGTGKCYRTAILITPAYIYMQDRKQQLELDTEQIIGSKLGKEYDKAVHCPPAYLTYMQNTSCERQDWINPKPE